MTGWRLGWLVVPPALLDAIGKLIEFNTSCAPVFVQRAGLAALQGAGATSCRAWSSGCASVATRCCRCSPPCRGVQVATPLGGMYAFFRVDGEDDSLAFAKRLVAEVGLGLAPGAAFGAEGEGWLRWCFASRDVARLAQGVRAARIGAAAIIHGFCGRPAHADAAAQHSTARVGFTRVRK